MPANSTGGAALIRVAAHVAAALFFLGWGVCAANPEAPHDACPVGDPAKALPVPHERVISLKKKAWEAALGGEAAARPHIQARLVGWPRQLVVRTADPPASDGEFAARLARDTWRGLEALTDRENGLPINNVHFAAAASASAASSPPTGHIGDYAGATDIGLHLIAIVAARELGFLSEAQAAERLRRVLDTLEHLETYRGFFFNYYDTTSLERTSNFVSFVDSSWLTAGLMVVRMSVPELYERCTRLIGQADYGVFYDPARRALSHGYYVTPGVRSPFDYGLLYTEARLGSLIAIGKGEVPATQWFAMARTLPAGCGWQVGRPTHVREKRVRGHTFVAGYWEWRGLRYVPSWGGSMFEALMPTLVLDETRYAPKSLGANDQTHAVVQRRYALEELGYPAWGLSPSAVPAGDGYGEYGAKVLGTRGYAAGAVTPYAAALALSVTPAEALADLRALAARYAMYGEYGFYDAVDPGSGTVAYQYLALDQSMLFIALANHLHDHCIQKRFAADPIVQRALPMIGDEDFFN